MGWSSPSILDDHTTCRWLRLIKPNIFCEGTYVIRDRMHHWNTIPLPQVKSPSTPKLCHRHNQLHHLSIIYIMISTSFYFVIIPSSQLRHCKTIAIYLISYPLYHVYDCWSNHVWVVLRGWGLRPNLATTCANLFIIVLCYMDPCTRCYLCIPIVGLVSYPSLARLIIVRREW
jgi:hypothetical protein